MLTQPNKLKLARSRMMPLKTSVHSYEIVFLMFLSGKYILLYVHTRTHEFRYLVWLIVQVDERITTMATTMNLTKCDIAEMLN